MHAFIECIVECAFSIFNYWRPSTIKTGAERLLRHLHSKGVHIALATSSSRENFELKTTHHGGVFELFHHIVTGSSDPEVKHGKPAPDIFLICASRFPEPTPQPQNVLHSSLIIDPLLNQFSILVISFCLFRIFSLMFSASFSKTLPTEWKLPELRGCKSSWCLIREWIRCWLKRLPWFLNR